MILAYDIGTTLLKLALIDKNGTFKNYESKRVLSHIQDDVAECNSQDYLTFLSLYLKKIDTTLIDAISISGTGPSIVPILGSPIIENNLIKVKAYPSRIYLDKRGQSKSKEVSEFYGEYIDGSFPLPSILAMRENESATFENTKSFLSADGLVNYALTNKLATVNSPKGLMKYYWNKKCLDFFNLSDEKFPTFVNSGIELSKITKEVAEAFNLREDVKVITAGVDFYVNILGSRANKNGVMCDRTGTSEGLNLCCDKAIEIDGLLNYEHPIKGKYNVSGMISTSGAAVDWIKDVLNLRDMDYNEFYKLAENSKPESNLIFLPYLSGERAPIWDPNAKGVMFGMGLDSGTAEVANAVVVGTGLALKDVIKTMEENGAQIDEINLANTHSLNNYYLQLKCDITGKKINIIDTQSPELLGIAILCYTELKEYSTIIKAIECMSKIKRTYLPSKKNVEKYEKMYTRYKHLYKVLKSEFKTI
jgi:xylulokinase